MAALSVFINQIKQKKKKTNNKIIGVVVRVQSQPSMENIMAYSVINYSFRLLMP